jgi:3-methyladenine DNA glycosylase AlkD
MKHYLNEVEAQLNKLPQRTSSQNPEAYIGGGQSALRFIGLRVPDLRSTYKKGFSFSDLSPAQTAKIWDYIWKNSDCFEVMALALMWFEDPKRRDSIKNHWSLLKSWSHRIDNWAHSDTLSGIYARIHEDYPKKILPVFQQWNRSKNPWHRRLSIVSLYYYSSQRNKYPSFANTVSMLKPLLDDDHYYVQKGVGWTLRESGNVYPGPTYSFIESNLHSISSIAFSAACEKMPSKKREHLKKLRKSHRKNPK